MGRRVLLFILVLSLILVVGCKDNNAGNTGNTGNSGSTGSTGNTGNSGEQPGTDGGGNEDREMVIAYGAMPSSGFNPFLDANLYENRINQQIYDALVWVDEDRNIVPSVAENIITSEDGKTYTFELRKGVMFSNGEELKASDVVFSIGLSKNSPYYADAYGNVESFEATDEYTVVVKMKTADAPFLEKLAVGSGFLMNEKAYTEFGDQYGKTPETTVGTGPYILTGWKPDVEVKLKANENYFKGAPDIKKIRMMAITDKNAAVIALQSGSLDIYMEEIPGVFKETVENDPNLTVSEVPSVQYIFAPMNVNEPPFDNVEVRRAVAYAIDREKAFLVGAENHGYITDNPGNLNYAGNPGYGTWYPMDVEKAKQIIDDAGLKGETITIKTYDFSPLPEVATSIQEDLSKIGLDVKIEKLEFNTFLQDTRKTGNYQMAVTRLGVHAWDMDDVMFNLFHSNSMGVYNYNRYSNPEMDALIIEGKSEMNPEKRKEIYARAIEIMTDEALQIPFFFQTGFIVHSKDITADPMIMQQHIGAQLRDYSWAK